MGFLEKLKNTFFEEEYVEVEEKPKIHKEVKKEPYREIKRENKVDNRVDDKVRSVVKKDRVEEKAVVEEKRVEKEEKHVINDTLDANVPKRNRSFDYFDEDDFLDFPEEEYAPTKSVASNVVKKEESPKQKLYDNPSYASKSTPPKPAPYSKQTKSGFQPTPIISPIYGILDKNYSKEEIIEKKDNKPSSYVSRKNVDLDSVREKAFGSLASDFDLSSSDKKINSVDTEIEEEFEMDDNLLYDMTNDDKTPTVDKVTLQDAEEYFQDLGLEYNIDYKDAKLEKATGRRVSKTPKIDEIEEEEIKENISSTKTSVKLEGDSSLEDNLFDLIDSMYEEKE